MKIMIVAEGAWRGGLTEWARFPMMKIRRWSLVVRRWSLVVRRWPATAASLVRPWSDSKING